MIFTATSEIGTFPKKVFRYARGDFRSLSFSVWSGGRAQIKIKIKLTDGCIDKRTKIEKTLRTEFQGFDDKWRFFKFSYEKWWKINYKYILL